MSTVPLPPDRRRWPRLLLAIPMFVRGCDALGRDFLELASTVDFSKGGALLVLRRSVPQGAPLALEIPRSPATAHDAPRGFEARSVRSASGHAFHYIGVEFDAPIPSR